MTTTQEDILIGCYGLIQSSLIKGGLLTATGAPKKLKKPLEVEADSIAIYRWMSQELKGVSEIDINKRKVVFNSVVKKLSPEYFLNKYLLAMFLMDTLMFDLPLPTRIMMLPKINRVIEYFSMNIRNDLEGGQSIVKDSKIASSNVYRLFNGDIELTKALRRDMMRKITEAI